MASLALKHKFVDAGALLFIITIIPTQDGQKSPSPNIYIGPLMNDMIIEIYTIPLIYDIRVIICCIFLFHVITERLSLEIIFFPQT